MKTAVSLSVVALVLSATGVAPCWAVSPDKLELQVEKLETRIGKARQGFVSLASLQQCRKSVVYRRDLTPDAKRALLDVADSAIRDLRSTHALPDHPALVPVS